MKYVKENYKFFIFIIIMGIIGGITTGIYSLSMFNPEQLAEVTKQIGSQDTIVIIVAIQAVIYAIICGFFGIILSNKIGLWNKIKFEKSRLKPTIIISIIGGLSLILCDVLIFNNYNDILRDSYSVKPSSAYIISSFTYGGVIEEVMLRLFFMSLIAFIIYKIFYKKEHKVPTKVFVISNIIAALLFAIGHLPATIQLFGSLSTMLIIRCFLLNGGVGLAFGWLYRKYGIQYSMLAHFGCHLVSKIIWLLFI